VSKDAPKQPMSAKARRFLNSVLLFAVLVLALVWFNTHLEPYARHSLLFGTPLTLWGFWRILKEAFDKSVADQTEEATERFMSKPLATEVLVIGLVLGVVLMGSTSSIYFEYDGTGAGNQTFDIEVVRSADSVTIMEPMTLSAYDGVIGQTFLWNWWEWRSKDIQVRVKGADIYSPVNTHLSRCRTVRLAIPGKLTSPDLYLLHLIPVGPLYNSLPLHKRRARIVATLSIDVNGQLHTVDGLRRQEVFLGCPERELKWAVSQADAEELTDHIQDWWRELRTPEETVVRNARMMQRRRLLYPTPTLNPHDTVTITVSLDDDSLVSGPYTVVIEEDTPVKVVYLEWRE